MGNNRAITLSKSIPKIYKRMYHEMIMFGYVKGQIDLLPSLSIAKALTQFYKSFDVSEDELSLNTAKQVYQRMINEFIDNQKTK